VKAVLKDSSVAKRSLPVPYQTDHFGRFKYRQRDESQQGGDQIQTIAKRRQTEDGRQGRHKRNKSYHRERHNRGQSEGSVGERTDFEQGTTGTHIE